MKNIESSEKDYSKEKSQQELEDCNKKIKLLEDEISMLHKKNKDAQFLEQLLTLIPEHIYWKNKDSVYLGCNDRFARMFGFSSRNQVIGKSEYELNNGINAVETIAQDQTVIKNNKATVIEETAFNHQGEKKIFLSHKVPVHNEKGEIIGLMGISFDITDKKETEQLRLKMITLEEQEATTRLIAASMAHELRTPLSAIQMGMEGIEGALPELFESYEMAKGAGLDVPFMPAPYYKSLTKVTGHVKQEARAALSVIDILLMNTSTSQIDKEKFKVQSIAQCVEDALARYPLQEDEIDKVHWKKSDFSFLGDEILMTHVLFNLLKNALYYLKAANKGDIHLWGDQNEQFSILYFKDTGLGIDADIVPHVFDRFYTRTRKGTGVGLAFCKLVMQSFGGDITCESIKGEYTQFTMTFPKL